MNRLLLVVLTLNLGVAMAGNLPKNHGMIEAQLFVGEAESQPLLVGFGGGEGGNAWASDRWKETRDEFLSQGYAFLAVGYFAAPNTPAQLDRISLSAIHEAIIAAAAHAQVNAEKIALIGGSKGAELVLNLASRYPGYSAVIALSPSHVSFPALTFTMDHSSWSFHDQEVPYVPATERIVPALLSRDFHTAFSLMLEDEAAVDLARIQVENIRGPLLLISAQKDEMWPSFKMSEDMVQRLKNAQFPYPVEHIVAPGDHASVLDEFARVFAFLDRHFK